VEGHSMQLRHVEYLGALSAVMEEDEPRKLHQQVSFRDALNYTAIATAHMKIKSFNSAMQFIDIQSNVDRRKGLGPEVFVKAGQPNAVRWYTPYIK
jgi:hypothetical protein